MDNKTDPKLIQQVSKLEKLVTTLAVRLQRVEAENKRLKSALIRTDMNVGQLIQKQQRG